MYACILYMNIELYQQLSPQIELSSLLAAVQPPNWGSNPGRAERTKEDKQGSIADDRERDRKVMLIEGLMLTCSNAQASVEIVH